MAPSRRTLLRAAACLVFVLACSSPSVADLEGLLFLKGDFKNPVYAESPAGTTQPISTDGVALFSGNADASAGAPGPGGPGQGNVRLIQSAIGAPAPGTVGWVDETPGADPKDAFDLYYTSGTLYVQVLRNMFDSYYMNEDPAGLDPEEVYFNFDFDPDTGDAPGYAAIFDEAAAAEAEENFYIAWRINQADPAACDGLLDVTYYQSTALIMCGNLELEKAYSVRFLEGIRSPGHEVIDDELRYLGWDSNTESFSRAYGAHRYFQDAAAAWLDLFNSPLRRAILLEREPHRTLVQTAKAFGDATRPTDLPPGEPWPPQVYDAYMDVAVMIRALAQRARVTDDVARRLVLLLLRTQAAELVNQTARDIALVEGVISSVLFPEGITAELGSDHASKYPGLAESFLTFRAALESMLRTRDAAQNPRFNALGFDKDIMLILPGENAGDYLFTYNWLWDRLIGPTGNPKGDLDQSDRADTEAETTKKTFDLKSAEYLSQFDKIEGEYDAELSDLCGTSLESPHTGGGLIEQQLRNIEVAKNGVQRVIRQMQNVHARIQIERDRVAKVHGILDQKAEMIINDGKKTTSLTQEIGEMEGWMAFADNMAQAAASAVDAISADPGKWGSGAAKSGIYAANAVAQKMMKDAVAKKEAQIERIRYLQEAQNVRFDRAIVDADSEAQIRTWLLDLETLKIDLLDAQIQLAQEMDRLERYYTKVESLVVRRDRALHRLTRRSFADPTYRIEVLNSALSAESKFRKAQIWVYLTAKALEYKWAMEWAATGSPYANVIPEILRTRTAAKLMEAMNTLSSADDALTLNFGSRLFYWNYSLRKDHLGMTFDKTIPAKVPHTKSAANQFQDYLADAAGQPENLVDLSGDGVPDHFAVRFSTVRFNIEDDDTSTTTIQDSLGNPRQADGQPIFDDRLWDDKIDWLQVNIIGHNVYAHNPQQMPIELWYGGTGYIRAREPFEVNEITLDYRVVPVPHVTFESLQTGFKWEMQSFLKQAMTAKLVADPREIPDYIFQTHNFREHPVAATDWRLLLPLDGTNIYNITDIEIVIVHRARTRQ